ncbi:MAG: hypothetical protein J6X56_04860 [Ruminococcus sp.]|nr:hypothetical protein [Ruminococcus sp.]
MPYCWVCGRVIQYGEKCNCYTKKVPKPAASQQDSGYGQQPQGTENNSPQQQYSGYGQQPQGSENNTPQQQYSGYGQQAQRPENNTPQQYNGYGQQAQRPYNNGPQQQYNGYGQQTQRPENNAPQQQYGSYGQQTQRPYNNGPQQQYNSYGQQAQKPYNNALQQQYNGYGQQAQRPENNTPQQYNGYGQQAQRPYNNSPQQQYNGYGQPYRQPYSPNPAYPYYGQTFRRSKSPTLAIVIVIFTLILITCAVVFIPSIAGHKKRINQKDANAIAGKLYEAANSAIHDLENSGENIRGTFIISSDIESNVAVPFDSEKFYKAIGYYSPPGNVEYFFVVRKGRVEYLASSEEWTYRKAAVGSCPENTGSDVSPRLYATKGNGPSAGKGENLDEIYWDAYDKLFNKE